MADEPSDFGCGLTYCLGLFLAHAERGFWQDGRVEIWFNGASDHLYDLEVPTRLKRSLRKRLKDFRKKVLHWGHGFSAPLPTEADKGWAIEEAKNLLLAIDAASGVKVKEATWK